MQSFAYNNREHYVMAHNGHAVAYNGSMFVRVG